VVGEDLLMTNRHVAGLFSDGLGIRNLSFKPGLSAGIDFHQERDHPQPEPIVVRHVIMIHPYWDMALLRTEGLAAHKPLRFSPDPPEKYSGELVAVIGYPAFDPRNPADVQNKVFNGIYNVKRLLPGKALGRRSIQSFGHEVSASMHDASTLGGNSGSAVFHPESDAVLGLHFAGTYLDANFFVPAFELSRDDRIAKAGVKFDPSTRSDSAQTSTWWAGVEAPTAIASLQPPKLPGATATGAGVTWTIPIQIQITVEVGPVSSLP
jgi:endonuclease G